MEGWCLPDFAGLAKLALSPFLPLPVSTSPVTTLLVINKLCLPAGLPASLSSAGRFSAQPRSRLITAERSSFAHIQGGCAKTSTELRTSCPSSLCTDAHIHARGKKQLFSTMVFNVLLFLSCIWYSDVPCAFQVSTKTQKRSLIL